MTVDLHKPLSSRELTLLRERFEDGQRALDPAIALRLIAQAERAEATPQAMLDGICEAVRVGLESGEKRITVSIFRDIVTDDDLTKPEFITVEGFRCANASCDRPFHVLVHASFSQYEYPDHLEHRHG